MKQSPLKSNTNKDAMKLLQMKTDSKSNTNETPMRGMNQYQTNFQMKHPYGEKDFHGQHLSENKRFHDQKEGINTENYLKQFKERS